jgi:hypothetical protein
LCTISDESDTHEAFVGTSTWTLLHTDLSLLRGTQPSELGFTEAQYFTLSAFVSVWDVKRSQMTRVLKPTVLVQK